MASSYTNYLLFSSLFAATLAAVMVAGLQFEVGGGRGWTMPTGNEPETYDEWAQNNRFHIGDTLYFKYQKDSVLVVSSADYLTCNTSNPISEYEDGNTVFQFDRSGLFYFISGEADHCKSGQKLVIKVMHHSNVAAPELAPSAGGDNGWDTGPAVNSTTKLSVVVTFLVTALVGVLVVFYLLM